MYKLLTIPQTDVGLTLLDLPLPNSGNCGGYRVRTDSGIIFAYSPIDITIVCISALHSNNLKPITDLSKWFVQNPNRIAEAWVTCTILNTEKKLIYTDNIVAWKIICKEIFSLKKLFKTNAPFTFRDI